MRQGETSIAYDVPIRSVSLGVGGPWIFVFWLRSVLALALAVWAIAPRFRRCTRSSRICFGAPALSRACVLS